MADNEGKLSLFSLPFFIIICSVIAVELTPSFILDIHKDLQNLLSKFKLEDLKNHAMKDFPEGSWSGVCEIVKDARETLKPKSAANAIIKLTKIFKINRNDLFYRLNILKLRESELSNVKTWFAYKMINRLSNHEDIPFRQIANYIEHHIRATVFTTRGSYDYNSILLGIKRGRQFLAIYITDDYLFVCPRTNNLNLLKSIVKAFGYNDLEYRYLSGRHIPSLLQILNQKKGAVHFEGVLSPPKYRPLPRRTRLGLDFTTVSPMKTYLNHLRGNDENAPCLQQLTLHAKAPLRGNCTLSTIILNSANVEQSLRDMTVANIIKPSSLFFSMINEHCKNEMKVKIE